MNFSGITLPAGGVSLLMVNYTRDFKTQYPQKV
jgi:hypothetical protein